jgi:hypothetical protein
MSWTDTIYVAYPDKATAEATMSSIGVTFSEDGSMHDRPREMACQPIVEWLTKPTYDMSYGRPVMVAPGEQRPGYWMMHRFNLENEEGAALYNAFLAVAGAYIQALDKPSNVFA